MLVEAQETQTQAQEAPAAVEATPQREQSTAEAVLGEIIM